MKRLTLLIFLGLAAQAALSQSSSLNIQVTDSQGTNWANGAYSITFIGSQPGTPYIKTTGQTFTTSFSGTLSASGTVSLSITDVAYILPANSTWQFCFTPATSQATKNCLNIPVTGSNPNYNSTITAAIIPPQAGAGGLQTGYADIEAVQTNGSQYYNIVSNLFRCLQNGTWVNCIGSSTGSPGGSSYELQYNNGGAFAGAAFSGLVYSNNTSSAPSAATSAQVLGVIGAAAVTNTYLANPSTTVNGQTCTLGGSCTVTANNPNALTMNNGGSGAASGSTYNGGAAVTISYNSIGAAPLASPSFTGTVTLPITGSTQCLHVNTSGAISGTGSDCGSGGGGDTITSPNITISIGGSSTNTTLDLAGAAGEIMAGATPALTYTPQFGVDNSHAGTLTLSNGSANAHTVLGSVATTTNTVDFFASVPTNLHTMYCAVSSTTCTLTDTGYAYNSIPNADLANSAITIAGTSVSLGGSTSSLPSPGAIGGTTPAAITGTTITANTSLVINGGTAQTGTQGTDTKLMTAGTVSGTSVLLCTDANGGATTSSCPSGSMPWPGSAGYALYSGSNSWSTTHITDNGTTISASEPLSISASGSSNISIGTDNSAAGTINLSNGSANAHTVLGSVATTTNTFDFPATVFANGDLGYCSVSSTTCTWTDAGYAYNAIPHADISGLGALALLNTLPLSDMATQAADTVVMNASGSSAAPTAVAMPTCTTGADLYNTTTHSWSCVSGGSGAPATLTLLSKTATYAGSSSDFSSASAPQTVVEFSLSATGQTYTLLSSAPAEISGNMPCTTIKNVTAPYILSILTGGSTTLDGVAFASVGFPLGAGQSTTICSDGANYHTLKGLGVTQSITANVGGMVFPVCTGCSIASNTVYAANRPLEWAFTLDHTQKVSNITYDYTVGTAGATGDFGIYDCSGNLLAHTGSQNLTTTGGATVKAAVTTAIDLPPGCYIAAACSSSTTVSLEGFNFANPLYVAGANSSGSVVGAGLGSAAECTSGVLANTTTFSTTNNANPNGFVAFLVTP